MPLEHAPHHAQPTTPTVTATSAAPAIASAHKTGTDAKAPSVEGREKRFLPLVLGSLGVVFGDIGTSPLYALREAVHATGGVSIPNVYGILSLIIWALLVIVTVKYIFILLRADNHGEGGTLALMALVHRALGKRTMPTLILAIFGAALFYGDAVITPAISVLSAVEGVSLLNKSLSPFIMPLALIILVALFYVQHRGTDTVSIFFGPVMLLWFSTLALTGLANVWHHPEILAAFNPSYGIALLAHHPALSLAILGAIFLAVTGAEALYADLGHFGRRPIQFSWLFFVFPALVLNYLGQGALVLATPEALANPFFNLMPAPFLIPFVGLATLATVIASQAVITGAHSLTHTAIQLGLMPRMEIRHTSGLNRGQIYLPRANLWLMIGVVFLVVAFHSSAKLASAYGIAVAGAMFIDTLMMFIVMWKFWHVRPCLTIALMIPVITLDILFISANVHKIPDGAWMPLFSGCTLALLMIIWVKGTRFLLEKQRRNEVPIEQLAGLVAERFPTTVAGTAVFLTADPASVPTALILNLKHNKVIHELNIILHVQTANRPYVPDEERLSLHPLFDSFVALTLRYGFMETPNVIKGLALCRQVGLKFDVMKTTYFLARRNFRASPSYGLPLWQDKLYITMARNADPATDFFRLPLDQVMEIGQQVKI